MRIALFSDVHGNRFALEAVLKDIETFKPDVIANLGDQVWGAADPAGAWELQQSLNTINVRGNTDEYVSSHFDSLDERSHAFGSWLRSKLPYDAPDQLAELPLTQEIADGEIVIAHGALHSTREALLFDLGETLTPVSPDKLLEQSRLFPKAKVFVVGHTHTEMIRSGHGVTFVNAGPVSKYLDKFMAARWVLLEKQGSFWNVCFRRVNYDIDTAQAWAKNHSPLDSF